MRVTGKPLPRNITEAHCSAERIYQAPCFGLDTGIENVLIEFADGSELGMDLRALESRIRLKMNSTDCPNGPKET